MNFIEVSCSPGPKVGPMVMPDPLSALVGGANCAFRVLRKSQALQRRLATSVETAVEISVEAPQVTPQVAGQVTGQVTGQVRRLLAVMMAEHSRSELQALLGLKHRDSFVASCLQPALAAGWVEMTTPDKPQSRNQRYRLTPAGKIALTSLNKDTP
jgi:hypothetical protein